jgi:hypothetical protein
MGLLDDAIREHLELKRRHGADPSEVERQEQEALGPPRRGEAAGGDEFDAADTDAGAVSVGTVDEDEPLPYDDVSPETEAEATPAGEPEAPVVPPLDEDEPDDAPGALPGSPAAGDEEPEARPPEDVLEETPEFLQETPEHDRLWFEQKPPRDFEF